MLLRLTIYEEFRIYYAYAVARQGYTSFDVIFALVARTRYYGVLLCELLAATLRSILLLILA